MTDDVLKVGALPAIGSVLTALNTHDPWSVAGMLGVMLGAGLSQWVIGERTDRAARLRVENARLQAERDRLVADVSRLAGDVEALHRAAAITKR